MTGVAQRLRCVSAKGSARSLDLLNAWNDGNGLACEVGLEPSHTDC